MSTSEDRLDALFRPRSVAVVGASERQSVGRHLLENMATLGYTGEVCAVNPKYEHVVGYPCVAKLADLPSRPDVVVAAVGRDASAQVVEDAARISAGGCIVYATGFEEAGEIGAEANHRISRVVTESGLALLGPNCQGLLNFTSRVPLWLDRIEEYDAGRAGLIAQSGSVGTALVNSTRGVRWSHIASTGNEVSVTCAEVLRYYVKCPDIEIICAFLESVRNPDEFFAACEEAYRLGKPVIVLKTGRTEEARLVAESHSGALAAPDRLVDALFRRHRVIRVDSLEELLSTAAAFRISKKRPSGRVAAMAASGGQIELLHDALANTQLEIVPFREETKQHLETILPEELAPRNPLDYWGTKDIQTNLQRLVTIVGSDGADILILLGDFTNHPTGTRSRAAPLLEAACNASKDVESLIVLLDMIGGVPKQADIEDASAQNVLVLSGLHESLRALEHLVWYSASTRRDDGSESVRNAHIVANMSALYEHQAGVVSGEAALSILESIGIDIPKSVVVSNGEEAVTVGRRLGYPVVAKIGAEDVLHKTEHNGVITGIQAEQQLLGAVNRLLEDGWGRVVVQEQIEGGVEMYLGLRWHHELGGFVVLGVGGIWAEVTDDVAIRPLGIRPDDPREMLSSLRAWPRLRGGRGQAGISLGSVEDALFAIDALGRAVDERISELDINPAVVTSDDLCALDAKFIIADK